MNSSWTLKLKLSSNRMKVVCPCRILILYLKLNLCFPEYKLDGHIINFLHEESVYISEELIYGGRKTCISCIWRQRRCISDIMRQKWYIQRHKRCISHIQRQKWHISYIQWCGRCIYCPWPHFGAIYKSLVVVLWSCCDLNQDDSVVLWIKIKK